MADDKVLRYPDVAKLLGLDIHTVKAWASDGVLRRHKMPGVNSTVCCFEEEVFEDIRNR